MFFDPQNSFWRTLAFVCDFVGLSLCWLLCSIPVVTMGAATCALYDAVYQGLRKEEEIRVYGRFFSTFKRELKTATLATLPFLLLTVVYLMLSEVVGVMALGGNGLAGVLVYAYTVIFYVFLALWLLAMAALSRFTFKAGALLSAAVQLAAANPLRALAVAVIAAAGSGLMGWWYISCIFTPALMAYLCSFFIEKIFAPFLPEEEEE